MTDVLRLSQAEARRIAIRAQMLDAGEASDVLGVVRQLTLLQLDPTAAIAPSADLVLWSRLGSSYRPADLQTAAEDDRTLFELDATVRPMSDLGLYLAQMAVWPTRDTTREWLRVNDQFRRDIMHRLEASGPLFSRDIPDTSTVPWPSSGWTNNRNVTQMLEFLTMRGEVAISSRRGRERRWDLAERVYPPDTPTIPLEEAQRLRNERRLRALGLARPKAPAAPIEPAHVGEAGQPAMVDGIPGVWRVDPNAIGQQFDGRTALLSPFDRLIHDRTRARELFDFDYTLEMYKPKAQRRWGYFALPILHNDRLVGKVDAGVNRDSGTLQINAIHEDTAFSRAMTRAVREELDRLASWLGASVTWADRNLQA